MALEGCIQLTPLRFFEVSLVADEFRCIFFRIGKKNLDILRIDIYNHQVLTQLFPKVVMSMFLRSYTRAYH